MQSKMKLTKRQVKEDRFTTSMLTLKDRMQDELEDKWQYYVIGLAVVVVLVWALIWQSDRQAAEEAAGAEAFSQAESNYLVGGDRQVAILEFGQIVDEYDGSAEAGRATFMLGNLNLQTRNYSEAIRYYQTYLNEFASEDADRAAAEAGIAAANEDQGLYAEAAQGFMKAIAAAPDGALAPDYQLGAMRNFLANGDLASAQARLDELLENQDGTDWAKQGQRMMAEKGSAE